MDIRKQESKHHLGFLLLGLAASAIPTLPGDTQAQPHIIREAASPRPAPRPFWGAWQGSPAFLGAAADGGPQCPESLGSLQRGLESSLSPDVLIVTEKGVAERAGREGPNGEGAGGKPLGRGALTSQDVPREGGVGQAAASAPLLPGWREAAAGEVWLRRSLFKSALSGTQRPNQTLPLPAPRLHPRGTRTSQIGAVRVPAPPLPGGRDLPRTRPWHRGRGRDGGEGEPRRPPPERAL